METQQATVFAHFKVNPQLTTESKTDSSSDSQSLRKLCKVPQNLLNRLAIQHGSLILLTPRCMGISVYICMDGNVVVVECMVSFWGPKKKYMYMYMHIPLCLT